MHRETDRDLLTQIVVILSKVRWEYAERSARNICICKFDAARESVVGLSEMHFQKQM